MELPDIGLRIKALRLENGLTQAELATRCELSKGFISQVESGTTVPSLETLSQLLEILGSSFNDFFNTTEDDLVVFKNDDYYVSVDEALKQTTRWIVPTAQKYEMEPIIMTLNPGGKSILDNPHAGEEFGYVIDGEITLKYGSKKYKLKEGETFYYRCNKTHGVENHGTKKAKLLWVSTPPMF